jgi:hypothetical protein
MDRLMIDPKDVYISPKSHQFSYQNILKVVLIFIGLYMLFKSVHWIGYVAQYIERQWKAFQEWAMRQIDEIRLKMHVKNGTFYQSVHKNI